MEDVYELFVRGTELLEAGHNHQATIPLARARDLAPDKTSIREALGRALFGARDYHAAAVEFEAVIDRAPTNDYALFCLGRSLQMLGRHAEARKPLALAACLQPGRRDYRLYRDRARARAARSADLHSFCAGRIAGCFCRCHGDKTAGTTRLARTGARTSSAADLVRISIGVAAGS